ncbi:hypothetical protein EXS74_00415 [Candidatus Woesearchaeota archaeon]|nr:hypothetical protein [Candidatus Woesearchaeota archaeon]
MVLQMREPTQLKLAIIGDCAVDHFIRETHSRFARYSGGMDIEQILSAYRKVEDEDPRPAILKRLGGPILTVGQYLAARDDTSNNPLPFDVSAVTILGSDPFSNEYRKALGTLGIKRDEDRDFEGSLARCAYVYDGSNPSKQVMAWEDGVSEHFKDIQVDSLFLVRQDVLVLSITEPSLAARVATEFRRVKPEGVLVYNPGPYLQDPRYSSRVDLFKSVIERTNILVVNRAETGALNRKLGLNIPSLFRYKNLQVMISTRDKDGSVIHYRDSQAADHSLYSKQDPTEGLKIVDPTGAGDAFLGTFLRYYLGLPYDIKDAHRKAKENAEMQLTQTGAVHESLLKKGKLPTFNESFGRYSFMESK